MATYYCKCGRTFKKSGDASTTGYRLKEYGQQHECYGCPYALPVTDNHWNSQGKMQSPIRAWECRASQIVRYGTYASLSLGSKTVGSIYSLDLVFLAQVQAYVQQIDGIFAESGAPGKRGVQYGSDGLYRLTIIPDQNKKGIAAKQALFDRFFYRDGQRKDISPEQEQEIILQRIEGVTMGKINVSNITAGLNKVKGITQSLKNVAKHELIPVEYIKIGYENPYAKNDTAQSRYELAMSLQANGLLNPLIVNKKSDTEYWLISGEHRISAINEHLHWPTVSCMVYDDISDNQARLMLHAVNLDVREYTTAQKLEFYQYTEQLLTSMKESGEFTGAIQQGIAETLKVSTRQVRKYKKIMEHLSPEDQQRVIDGELSIEKAYQMTMPPALPKQGSSEAFGSTSDFELPEPPDPNQLAFDGVREDEVRETVDHPPQNGGDGQNHSETRSTSDFSTNIEEKESISESGSYSEFDSDFWDAKIKFAIKRQFDCERILKYYTSFIPTPQEATKDILKPDYGHAGGTYNLPDGSCGDFTRKSAIVEIDHFDGKRRRHCTLTYSQIDAYIRQMIREKEFH